MVQKQHAMFPVKGILTGERRYDGSSKVGFAGNERAGEGKGKDILLGKETVERVNVGIESNMHANLKLETPKHIVDGSRVKTLSAAGSSMISKSADSESCEDELSNEDVETLPSNMISKKKEKSGNKSRKNVLQIPHKVIRNSSCRSHWRVDLVDSETGNRYGSDLHAAERKYYVERFLGYGWNDFVSDRRLGHGWNDFVIRRINCCYRVKSVDEDLR
ncbi:hypothetical protein RYX36_022973 [Vicia faba]